MERYQVLISCDAKEALGHECLIMDYEGEQAGDPDTAQVSAMDGAIENGWLGLHADGLWLCPKCADEWRDHVETAAEATLPEDKPGIAKMARQIGVLADLIWQEAGE